MHDFTTQFMDFVAQSPSSFHAAATSASIVEAAGFRRVERDEQLPGEPGAYYMTFGGAFLAWRVPKAATADAGDLAFQIVGAHNDSPGFKLKQHADASSFSWVQANVEVYGGPIVHTWFDRELVLAGEVSLRDGSTRLVQTPPVLRIPTLAIHLEQDKSGATAFDRQRHTQPVLAVGDPEASVLQVVAEAAGVDAADIVAHDLITSPAEAPAVFGANQDLLASQRLDNLSSVFPAVRALADAEATGSVIPVVAAFDHEEVGSGSVTGAGGPLLQELLERIGHALGWDVERRARVYARSLVISADAAHSVHPNFSERYDPHNYPVMGQGPAVKVNANQRYASNAQTTAAWLSLCDEAGVASQTFVGNNAVPCGTTIGPITAARVGIPTVDVGIPLLSMHSARELAHVEDVEGLYKVLLTAFRR